MRPGSRRRPALLAAFLLVASSLLAATAPGQNAVEDRVREIAAELRCPVCQNLSVADSPSEMAQQMRAVIRERLAAGESREAIEAYFVAKYGQWILLSPRQRGFNLLLWIGPFAALVLGLLAAARLARRWARRRAGAPPPAVDPALLERVRAEAAGDEMMAPAGDPDAASPLERERARLYEALRELTFDHHAGKLSASDYEAVRGQYEARAAVVLVELDRQAHRRGQADGPAGRPPRPAARAERDARVERRGGPAARRRSLRTALAGAFLLVFGVTLGVFLTEGIRPRTGPMDSITGDFLTGTGPGGMSASLSFRGSAIEAELAEDRAAFERRDLRMAIDHFKRVLAAEPRHPTALGHLGAILWQAGHTDAALETVERALAAAPDHPLALWTKGNLLYEVKGDYAGAIQTWEALLRQPLAPADADAVARMLTEARQRVASTGPATPVGNTSPTAVTGSGPRIVGSVALAGATPSPSNGTLFVIARRSAGPPLAVKRIVNPTFPVSFTLGPEDVMVPGTDFTGEVTLVARLKRDGRAGPAVRGDLEGVAPTAVAVGATDVHITLEPVP